MVSKYLLPLLGNDASISSHVSNAGLVIIVACVAALAALYSRIRYPTLPCLNPQSRFGFSDFSVKAEFAQNARRLLEDWFKKCPDKPAILNTDLGPVIVLPPHVAEEIRNDKRFDFRIANKQALHAHLPGFEVFNEGTEGDLGRKVILKYLTKELSGVTKPLVDETSLALSELFSDSKEWHSLRVHSAVLRLITRISSRIFLGSELCRNEKWLKISREYTMTFYAAEKLRMWPSVSRWVVNWFLPECRAIRALVKEGRALMEPVLQQRQQLKAQALAQGEKAPEFHDAIEWCEIEAGNRIKYDPVLAQLALSLVAIHTTSDLMSQTLIEIARHPEIVEPLRNEIVSILEETGWDKQALQKMKLLDSVIKESQRLKPIAMATMTRVATENVTLSDGTLVYKGQRVCVSSHKMWDPKVHDEPHHWDPYRFLNMRQQPEKQHSSQLVATGQDHLAFGHGRHACPGRFFAANEIKLALAAIILRYDLELPEGVSVKNREHGFQMSVDPTVQLRIRQRADTREW